MGKAHSAQALVAFCFLNVDVMWPAASSSFCLDFPLWWTIRLSWETEIKAPSSWVAFVGVFYHTNRKWNEGIVITLSECMNMIFRMKSVMLLARVSIDKKWCLLDASYMHIILLNLTFKLIFQKICVSVDLTYAWKGTRCTWTWPQEHFWEKTPRSSHTQCRCCPSSRGPRLHWLPSADGFLQDCVWVLMPAFPNLMSRLREPATAEMSWRTSQSNNEKND